MIVSSSVISEILRQSLMAQLKLSRAVLPIAVPMPMLIQTQQPLPPFIRRSSSNMPRLKLQSVEQPLTSLPGWSRRQIAARALTALCLALPFAAIAVWLVQLTSPPGWKRPVAHVVSASHLAQPSAITAVIDAPPWSSLVVCVVWTSSVARPSAITVGQALHHLRLRQRGEKRSRKDSSQAGASGLDAFHQTQLLGRLHSDRLE